MKISVIIPIYNSEDFVETAYDFISNQKTDLPLEIIFVDNNSTDNSKLVASKIKEKDQRVKVFSETKQGAPSARNKGFINSTGELIYFFDVDDQLFTDSLNSLAKVLIENTQFEAVFGKMIKSHESVFNINEDKLIETGELMVKEKPYWGLYWFRDLSKVVGPPAFMYRRETFKKLGMYNEAIPASEDTALDIDLGMTCHIAKLDKYVYLYYKHPQATTTLVKAKKDRVFMQWPRLIKSHVPFYVNNKKETEYGNILKKKVYSSIPKMIYLTAGFSKRKSLSYQLVEEIKPLRLPLYVKLFSYILVFIPNKYILKFYLYYVLKYFSK